MNPRRWLLLGLAIAAVLLILGRALAGAYADFLWYESLGASALWRARTAAVVTLRVGSALLAALFGFANFYAVRRSVVSLVFPRRIANLEIGEEVPGRYLIAAALALALVLGALLALPSDQWSSLILARSGQSFNETEGYFGQDLSFFVYWLPLENALWIWAFFTMVVVAVAVILLYALTPSLKWQRGTIYVSSYVRRHFTILVGVLLLMLAWSFRLDMYSLLIEGSGPDGAFAWSDHKVGVPGDLLMSLLTFGAALIVMWAGFVGRLRFAAVSVVTIIVLSLVIREIAPVVADHTGSDAQRVARERPYVGVRATYSRHAFAVDAVPYADSSLLYPSLSAALPGVPIWDPPALARVTDGGRSPGDLPPLVGWRVTSVGLIADVIDAREPSGVVRTPWGVAHLLAAEADDRGAPVRAPDVSPTLADDTPIESPLVFPGARVPLVIADTLSHTAGIPLDAFGARLATAWSTQNFHLLSGDIPQPRTTIVTHRDIRDRVGRFVPFFIQGRRVEPVVLGDSLYWTLDLYSGSGTYPLSRHSLILGEDRSYLHHAAIAIVQASSGDVIVVADSALDPIAATWKTRLPSLFASWSTVPAGIRVALSPPIDGLVAQADAFGRYGTRTENDAPRSIPGHDGADSALTTDHLPIVLPNSRGVAIAIPLVDEKDRIGGLFIGLGGGSTSIVWYPLSNATLRWNAALDRLRSLDSTGSPAREGPLAHGRVRVVPLRSGLGFVQPTYRWRSPNAPVLNRVALVAGDTTRSLTPPIGTQVVAGPAPPPLDSTNFRGAVTGLYSAMRDALRRGDLVAFGHAFDALGKALADGARKQPGAIHP